MCHPNSISLFLIYQREHNRLNFFFDKKVIKSCFYCKKSEILDIVSVIKHKSIVYNRKFTLWLTSIKILDKEIKKTIESIGFEKNTITTFFFFKNILLGFSKLNCSCINVLFSSERLFGITTGKISLLDKTLRYYKNFEIKFGLFFLQFLFPLLNKSEFLYKKRGKCIENGKFISEVNLSKNYFSILKIAITLQTRFYKKNIWIKIFSWFRVYDNENLTDQLSLTKQKKIVDKRLRILFVTKLLKILNL